MKTSIKRILLIIGVLVVIGGSIAYYMFNMPHRDVQATDADASITATALVNEYLSDYDAANAKYLDDDGESNVLVVSGTIADIKEDYQGDLVILLQGTDTKAGVSCTLLTEEKTDGLTRKIGDEINIKGVIRAGARYDEDLEMYESVILEKAAIVHPRENNKTNEL